MGTLTITIVGSLSVLLLVFPIPAVQNFIKEIGLTSSLSAVNQFTISSLALYVAFLIAKNLVQEFMPHDDGSRAGLLSLLCFLIITPLTVSKSGVTSLSFDWIGASGIFTAMFTGLVVGRFFVFATDHHLSINLPETVPPMVRQNFDALIPGAILAVTFTLLHWAFAETNFGSVSQAVYTLIQTPLKGIGGNIWSIILIATLGQVFWFFGLHGTNLTIPIVQPLWMAMDAENLKAAAAGQPLPNEVGYAFFCTYTLAATAIGFAFLMLFAKSQRYKTMGKITFPAAIFGISEPMVFGVPLVLNFTFAIPFIFTNGIVLFIAYLFTHFGIIPPLMGATPVFGLPLGFHAAIQGSWKIIAMQIFTQIIGAAIWYPFLKIADNKELRQEQLAQSDKEEEKA